MEFILKITGNVKFTITLDPGVWIFDDRKFDLSAFLAEDQHENINAEEKYLKEVSAHWDREITEGSAPPQEKTTAPRVTMKEKILNSSFAIQLAPFLKNAEILPDSKTVTIVTATDEFDISLDEAMEAVLAFSHEGKPLKDDGPVHFYYGDKRNKTAPVKYIRQFIIK